MSRLRILSFIVLGLVSCREAGVSSTTAELRITPAQVDFGRAFVGHRARAELTLTNAGRAPLEVTLAVAPPFDAPASVRLEGGQALTVELGLLGAIAGPVEGVLNVGGQLVPLFAEVLSPPACAPQDCQVLVFNPETGGCDGSPAHDGAACGQTNQCLAAGVCSAGTCVGRARDCDDGNACTADACEPLTGCFHQKVSCPLSLRSCEVATCDPALGCGLSAADDGVSCGPNDCLTAQVCIAGDCVARVSPEGSACAEATTCRGPGACQAQRCTLPAPTPLQPSWRYQPASGRTFVFSGLVDDFGNAYATETVLAFGADGGVDVMGLRTELLSFSADGTLRFREEVAAGCSGCRYGLSLTLDSVGRRAFFNVGTSTQARSLDDGQLLWTAVPSMGLPVYNPTSSGQPSFSSSTPLLLAGDAVGVPVSEGSENHHAYVQVYERQTGVFRWQFRRKGHLYGTGASGSGQLWTSSADCWAPAGEMARVDETGRALAARFVSWIPSIYGEDVAIGTASGKLFLSDGAMNLRDLGFSSANRPLLTGGQLVLWDNANRVLRSVSLTDGGPGFVYAGVGNNNPDFELLRDGGVAWTAQGSDGGVLGAVDGRGQELIHCPLATPVQSPTAILGGRAYVAANGGLVVYPVPGLDVEPVGWVAQRGSLQRGNTAR